MPLNKTNIVLASLLLLVAFMTLATRVDFTQPNIEILPDMKYTPAWTAYASNPVFENGRTLQAPVPGTIPRGHLPLHFEPTIEDAVRAGQEIMNPYQSSLQSNLQTGQEAAEGADEETALADATTQLQESIRRGAETYRVFCTCCHGATGAGDGPVTKRGFPPPPSLLTGKSRAMKDGQLLHVLTYGQASMPDFRGQLTSDRRWDAINYIRDMQSKAGENLPASEPANSDPGETDAAPESIAPNEKVEVQP